MSAILLEARGLAVAIGGRTLCRALDMTLRSGERLAILGRNGAGKSTLLATLAGLRDPAAGEVLIDGQTYAASQPRQIARRRGWLPQASYDAFASTVLETALVGRHPHIGRWNWESDQDVAIARAALASTSLAGLEQRAVHSLSGGERQRLALATLLTQQPALYLLDEPLAHLDLNHQIATLELFSAEVRERDGACVMVLHDPGLAARYCDSALLLFGDGEWRAGPGVEVITTENLSRLYAHPLRELRDGEQRWFVPA
jgi:iron complex transport system ATP-binding protein